MMGKNPVQNKYTEYFEGGLHNPDMTAYLPQYLYALHAQFVGVILDSVHRSDSEKVAEIRAIHEALNAAISVVGNE